MGSAAGGRGLALLRLDRAAEALSRGEALLAGDVPVRPIKQDWARFDFSLIKFFQTLSQKVRQYSPIERAKAFPRACRTYPSVMPLAASRRAARRKGHSIAQGRIDECPT